MNQLQSNMIQQRKGRGRPPKNIAAIDFRKFDEQKAMNNIETNLNEQSRDFQCQKCQKSYLSSPALYLHIKNKHPDENARDPNIHGLKQRGRPRKDNQFYGQGSHGGRLDPTSDLFLKFEHRDGGPTDPISSFLENVKLLFEQKYNDPKDHPMFIHMYQNSYDVTPFSNEIGQNYQKYNQGQLSYQDMNDMLQGMSEERLNQLNCEQLLSFYLRDCAEQVNSDYYSTMVQFILMYRDCLNIYGWQKIAENDCKGNQGESDYEQKVKLRIQQIQDVQKNLEFTQINNAEYAPEVSNEFVTIYLENPGCNPGQITISEIIDLTQHFCNWLFQKKLTCSKLSMA